LFHVAAEILRMYICRHPGVKLTILIHASGGGAMKNRLLLVLLVSLFLPALAVAQSAFDGT
jgi:hypothetical protein